LSDDFSLVHANGHKTLKCERTV